MEKDTIRFQLQHSLCKRQTILTFAIPNLLKIAKPRWIWMEGGGISLPPLHLKKHMKVIWLPFPWRPMGVSSIPSHTQKRGERAGSDDRLDLLRSRVELRGRGWADILKDSAIQRKRLAPEYRITRGGGGGCKQKSFFARLIKYSYSWSFQRCMLGMEDRNTKTWMESLLLMLRVQQAAHAEIECRFSVWSGGRWYRLC